MESMYRFIHVFSLVLILSTDCNGEKQKSLKITVQYEPEHCDARATAGDEVALHYTGSLESGVVFDSSIEAKRDPISFILGKQKVIQGWEQGIEGMCVGEKRKLIIPPHLAYGSEGRPPVIPGHATLIFEIELMSLKKESVDQSIMKTAQFLAVPALIVYVIYYLYDKYKKETESKAKSKEDKRGKKRK